MAATRRSARLTAKGSLAEGSDAPEPTAMAPPPRSRKRKSAPADPSPADHQPAPTTPQKRRARKVEPAPPPATPTPSNVGLIAESGSVDGLHPRTSSKPQPRALMRLADPNATNAPLMSPETSRVIAPGAVDADASFSQSQSPSKGPPRTTTDTLLDEGCSHLIRVDPRMRPLVEQNHCHIFSPEGLAQQIDPFESLASGIISQQVSGAAAKAIKKRFVELFENGSEGDPVEATGSSETGVSKRFPHPSQVAKMSIEKLRTAGLSQRKAEYLSGLAEKFVSGELSAKMLADAPYEEVLEKLIAVRGLGRWSVEMFACFALKRMDVFSLGDLGVQRGMAAFMGRDVAKLKSKGGKWKYMTEKEMEEISSRFSPYRSLFMWYMWRVEETDISTFE